MAVWFKGSKIGFVPRKQNFMVAQLIRFGHKGILEARVTGVNPHAHPEEQVHMAILLRDAR